MDTLTNYSDLQKEKQNQILKLVTRSFYKELSSYGVDAADIVKVSVNLLDYVTSSDEETNEEARYYNKIFSKNAVHNHWASQKRLTLGNVTIQPLLSNQIPQVCKWLNTDQVSQTFIGFFPREKNQLQSYLLDKPDRFYFSILVDEDHFVGIIGAEQMDETFRKLEMKKFVGDSGFQGKGVGKAATFLFLYYSFMILNFNKVFIYSLDTNIKNINLNSKFGFDLEGILYEEAHVGGVYKDVLRMGLLSGEWNTIFSSDSEQ